MASNRVTGTLNVQAGGASATSEGKARSAAAGRSRYSREFVQQASIRDLRYVRRGAETKLANWLFHESGRSSFDAVTYCGRALAADVSIKSDGARAWPSGVAHCGRVWLCPVCAAKIKARRAVELETACNAHAAAGGSFSMVTATARHDRTMSLREVRTAVASSWRKVQRRKSWAAIRSLVDGQVVAPEVTVGDNGWHPHAHVLLFVKAGAKRSDLNEQLPAFVADWRELVNDALGSMPSVERGVHLLHFGTDAQAAAAGYLSKVAKELTAGNAKSGRDPFTLLDGVGDGDAKSIARWIEFADAMKGVQSISWSKGLRSRLGLDVELTDEEIAALDDEVGVEVARVYCEKWNMLLRQGRAHELLREVEMRVRASGLAPPPVT